ncbi:MAG: nicotinamide riboside kinase [Saprospiraceae bacterium]|jgi:nicotinamide riboside kinase|tara:strand:+ start:56 stop:550 length:495 start_codon:yes stop_codon:yes gene_type:complete
MKTNIPDGKQIIVVTGPESSGKTTLVNRMKADYGMPTVREFARTYLEKNGAEYELSDLEIIGKCQNIQELEAHNIYPIIVCDTDIITIDIWSMEVFGKSISLHNNNATLKHYLLCKPDIPWEPGDFRENPNDRDRLFGVYYKYIDGRGLSFEVLDKEGRKGWKV